MHTISGTSVIERGECVGFLVRTEEFPVESPRVIFGSYEIAPSFFRILDAATVEVGLPCFFTGLDLALGPLDVSLVEDERDAVAEGAFEVVETTRIGLGEVPATSAGSTDADANGLAVAHDFDVYEWSAPAGGWLLAETAVTSGADPAFQPYTFVARATLSPWWNGHELVLVPAQEGDHVAQIADYHTGGGDGYDYVFQVSPLAAPVALHAADGCDEGAAVTGAGFFTVDLTAAVGDLDPAGAPACADRHRPFSPGDGDGVRGPGPDRAVRLVVGSGQTLSVAARGAVTDPVLYLLEDGCGAVTECLAAADTFGTGDTDTLLWTNGGATRMVWLVVDEAGGGDSDPGPVDVLLRLSP